MILSISNISLSICYVLTCINKINVHLNLEILIFTIFKSISGFYFNYMINYKFTNQLSSRCLVVLPNLTNQ